METRDRRLLSGPRGLRLRPTPLTDRALRFTALAGFFFSGFAALVYQVVWQRLLVGFSGADVYSSTVIVAAFMAGLGVGHLVGGQVADRVSRRRALILFAVAELSIGSVQPGEPGTLLRLPLPAPRDVCLRSAAAHVDPVYESSLADVLHGCVTAASGSRRNRPGSIAQPQPSGRSMP